MEILRKVPENGKSEPQIRKHRVSNHTAKDGAM